MPNTYYLIDDHFTVKPLSAYLSHQAAWDTGNWISTLGQEQIIGNAAGPALPITPDGQLRPGVLYESSVDPNTVFYLPEYQLHKVDGRYTTRLKWRSEQDDPEGPLAFLTVEVIARPVLAGELALQEIPHQATARIVFQMPVEGVDQSSSPLSAFLGNWSNMDDNTGGMTRLEILPLDDQQVQFHGFGKCSPVDCDWGLTPARMENDALIGVYEFGFKQTRITVRRHNNLLSAELVHHFAPGDGRPDRTEYEMLAGGNLVSGPADTRPVLAIEIGALEATNSGVRRAQLAIMDQRDFDRLYQVMTDSNLNSRLEIRCFATAGRRTWRQLVLGHSDFAQQVALLREKRVIATDLLGIQEGAPLTENAGSNPNLVKIMLEPRTTPTLEWKEVTELVNPAIIGGVVETATPPILSPTVSDALIDQATRVNRLNPTLLKPIGRAALSDAAPAAVGSALGPRLDLRDMPSTLLSNLVVQPVLERAFARPLSELLAGSDLQVRVDQQEYNALPLKALLAENGQPALIQINVESLQTIAPFWFSVTTHIYVFDLPGHIEPGTNHILLRRQIFNSNNEVVGIFYQDSAYRDQCYYEPQEFRIPRLAATPYLPDIRIAFLNIVSQDNGTARDAASANQATLHYKVLLTYHALPYIDPLLLDLAQQQVPEVKANFNALLPATAQLSLRVPTDETGGALTTVPRPDAIIDFDHGIVDEIELSQTEFERIFAFFTSASGVGIEGLVTAALLGNMKADVPVKLSLKQHAGPLFTHTYLGPQPNGQQRVQLLNRIESPVKIESLYRVTLGRNVFAFPQTTPGAVVPPNGTLDLAYSLQPADALVADIAPALATSINPEPMRLWPQLFINQGYIADTFTVTVKIEAGYFGTPPPGENTPLTGVEVEFDDTTITLTAERLTAVVTLRMPLLPYLLNNTKAKQYQYTVTNLLGDDKVPGAKSEELHDEGEELTVVPVGG